MAVLLAFEDAVDIGYGRGRLAAPAAASLARVDAAMRDAFGRYLDINEAWRSPAQADANYAAYLRDPENNPIALPASQSIHCRGFAIDTDDSWAGAVAILNDHGWFQTVYRNGVLVEPWHFEYDAARDNHRYETASSGSTPFEEDDMFSEADRNLLKDVQNKLSIPGAGYGRPEVIQQRVDAIVGKLETGAGYDWLPAIANQGNAILAAIGKLGVAGAPVDVDALADALREGLGDEIAQAIGAKLVA